MEIVQRRQQLQDVGNRGIDREQAVCLVVAPLFERGAAHVLHYDEAAVHAGVIDEVENLHDSRVRNIRQELALDLCGGGLV